MFRLRGRLEVLFDMTRGAGRVGTYVGRGSQPLAEDPTSTGPPHNHSPVTGSPITSPHTCSTPIFGSPSSVAATSSSLDGGSFIVSRGGRYPIQVISNKLHPSEPVARRIIKIFKEKMDLSGHDWKSLTPEVKEFYWHEFQIHLKREYLDQHALSQKGHSKELDRRNQIDKKVVPSL